MAILFVMAGTYFGCLSRKLSTLKRTCSQQATTITHSERWHRAATAVAVLCVCVVCLCASAHDALTTNSNSYFIIIDVEGV